MSEITRLKQQMVADVDVDDDGLVTVHVVEPLTPDEARAVAQLIIEAAATGASYHQEQAELTEPAPGEIVHGSPLVGLTTTTCCGRDPFTLPATDRITSNPLAVTCSESAA
jgi:hypothetical protein